MKRLLLILILSLSFQSWTKADDIRDFQIEGISLGDSLLDFYSKEVITNAIKDAYYYPDRKFLDIFIEASNNSNYEWLQITLKSKDKKFKTHTVTGQIDFSNNIKECYKKKKEIVKEIRLFFQNKVKIINDVIIHPIDKSGKSKVDTTDFNLEGGSVQVQCFDWNSDLQYTDKLTVHVKSQEAVEYFSQAYK